MAYSNLFKDEQTREEEYLLEKQHNEALDTFIKSNKRLRKIKKICVISMIILVLISAIVITYLKLN